MVLIVPPVRERMGYKPAERIPTTFPCTFDHSLCRIPLIDHVVACTHLVPNRPRRPTLGYEDP